ncbi:20352_t:CDS:2 [Gigaspora margarita]|uniref:20352_t:CDS:1 n=1 Tax=Gigaspora margarita TaxID=4874 RepID=A0ABM8W101_GIGMA|nr:20352_t:CDS:2 [Gigaspora margarita]
MSSNYQYDPGNDAINTVIIGILPALVVVLFKGFKNEKRNPSSFINGFDDFIILFSITINPSISAFQWASSNNRATINLITGYISFISFCLRSQPRLFSLLKVKETTYFMISFVNLLVALTSLVVMFGYSILVIGNNGNIGFDSIISFNHIAILSGYLLSTNSILTKILFALCIISLSRLIEHFGDNEPEKVTTIISYYLNYNSNMHIRKLLYDQLEDKKKQLEKIVDQVGFKNKEVINGVKNSLENQTKVISQQKFEINNIKDVVKALTRQIKILHEEIKELQGEIRELQENQQVPQEELKVVATLEEIVKRLEIVVETLSEIVKRLEMIVEELKKKNCKGTTNITNGNANSLPILIN